MTPTETRDYLATEILKWYWHNGIDAGGDYTGVPGWYSLPYGGGDWKCGCNFDPLTNLNHLAMVLGALSEDHLERLELMVYLMWQESGPGPGREGFTLLLFAKEAATLCRLIVEAHKGDG